MSTFLFEPTPHEEAVDFIKSKPALTRRVFDQLLPELKGRAFTVAGIEHAETLQRLRDTVAELPAGGDWRVLKKRILEDVSPYFLTSDDPEERAGQQRGAERRAELLLRTHGQQAYAAASYRDMDAQRDLFPFWQYLTLHDRRVRPTHAALDKIVLPHDSPFWQTHFPPWEWACRCQAVPLSQFDADEVKAGDASRAPEARQFLEGSDLQRLEQQHIIVRHADPEHLKGAPTPINVQSPAEAGRPGAFSWHPGELRLSVDDLRKRYDAGVFARFEGWAKAQPIPELKQSVWEWLHGPILGPTAPAAIVPAPAVASSFDGAMSKLGLDTKVVWVEKDVRDLLKAMKKPGVVKVPAKLSAILGAEKTGPLSEKALKQAMQGVLDLLPPSLAQSLPEIKILVVNLPDESWLGEYSTTSRVLKLNHGLLGVKAPELQKETVWHELMHWIHLEGTLPQSQAYRDAITAHFKARTAGEKKVKLGYGASTKGKRDKWWNAYAGRIYEYYGETGTEVPTRYFQLLANPAHFIEEMTSNEHAAHLLETLKIAMTIFDPIA